MAQIQTVQMDARYGAYKLFSGTAVTTARALVKIHQMTPDGTQRNPDYVHIQRLKRSMESEGVRKGEDIHGYIDVQNPAWGNRPQDEIISLLRQIDSQNKVNDDGTVVIAVLPEGIPLKITNGCHRLHALCGFLDENWNQILNRKPPLDSTPENCPFANGLSRPSAEILAQDEACWVVRIEYIRE